MFSFTLTLQVLLPLRDAQTPSTDSKDRQATLNVRIYYTVPAGMNARLLPEGMAFKFHAGTDIIFQIHYAPLTYATTDSSSINLFYSNVDSPRLVMPLKVTENKITEPSGLFIPANTVTTFHSESSDADGDLSWIGISPHAHQLCMSFKVFAVNPFGDTIPLVNVPKWNFDWQLFTILLRCKSLRMEPCCILKERMITRLTIRRIQTIRPLMLAMVHSLRMKCFVIFHGSEL